MNMLAFLDGVVQFLQFLVMILPFLSILSRRYSYITTIIVYGFFALAWGYLVQPIPNLSIRASLGLFLFVAMIVIFFKNRPRELLFAGIIELVLVVVSEATSVFLLFLFLPGFFLSADELSYPKLMGRLLFAAVFAIISNMFLVVYHRTKLRITAKTVFLYSFFPVSQIILLLGICTNNVNNMTEQVILFELLGVSVSIIANMMLIKMLGEVSQKAEIQEKLASVQSMQEMELAYYNLVQQHAAELSMIRHDFKDQIATAYGVISQYSQQEQSVARDILDSMSSNLSKVSMPMVCANRIVNTVVNVKRKQAEALGIVFEAAIQVPEDICVSSIDLCSLYSNLLNNAIEACERITDPNIHKHVAIASNVRAGFLIIKVTNPIQGTAKQQDGRWLTSKQDKELHGLGITMLQTIAKRYHGHMNLEQVDGIFTVSIVLELSYAPQTV